MGYEVDCVDISKTYVRKCRKLAETENLKLNAMVADMRDYDIQENHYSLIITSKVLHYFRKPEIESLVNKIRAGLKKKGLLYCNTFSTEDIELARSMEGMELVEENTYYYPPYKRYYHFFEKKEFLTLFSKLKTIYFAQGLDLDLRWGKGKDLSKRKGRLNGFIEYIGQRVR
jgi:2-polyprenyl-3-methyl-5-hydroxy-6-metoxy-1,4-benzoquinol methylase